MTDTVVDFDIDLEILLMQDDPECQPSVEHHDIFKTHCSGGVAYRISMKCADMSKLCCQAYGDAAAKRLADYPHVLCPCGKRRDQCWSIYAA